MKTRTFLHSHCGGGVAVGISYCALLLALLPAPLPAQAPTVTKLLGRATTPQANNEFGSAVAVSDSFLLVGEYLNDDKGENAGAAHLFDARSGKYLRKLTAKDAAEGDQFGRSVALSGHLALIGASGDDGRKGAAYLFDARTGKQLRKLTASDGAALDQFGISVALSGNLALIGADGDDNYKGAAYLFDARSGIPLATGHAVPGKLTASDGAALNLFGGSVALSGHLALIGAWGDDDRKGAAYLFDARSGQYLRKFTAADGVALDYFGGSVALSGNLVLIGATGDTDNGDYSGSAYLFDARTGVPLATGHAVPGKLTASDGAAGDDFGWSVALSGNLALIGAHWDDDNDFKSGSAYFIRPLAAPLPLVRVATKAALAPGAADANFNAFPQAFINSDGETVLQATLSGKGARGGRNRGVWEVRPA